MTGRGAVAAMAVLTITGCATVTVQPAEPIGPQLVIEVTNASDRDRTVGYTFEHLPGSGAGEGSVAPCERTSYVFGEIVGTYAITVDGATVLEGAVPAGAPVDAWVVVRVRIDPGGEAAVIGRAMVAQMQEVAPRPIAGCG